MLDIYEKAKELEEVLDLLILTRYLMVKMNIVWNMKMKVGVCHII